jgi:uncharacterized membrane protein YeaQ/YmgE (transglycosylase-associated protein family)
MVLAGLAAGWLAGQIVQGTGFGLIGDMVIGTVGACVGDRLMPRLGIHLGIGTISAIINATIGAIRVASHNQAHPTGGSGIGWSRW